MIRIHTASLMLLFIALGCGQQAAPKPAVDTNSWTLTVNKFSQLDSQSALVITVDTPVSARVTFHEPHSNTSQSFLFPGGTVYDIRKTLETTDDVDRFVLKTRVNGSGASVFHFAGVAKPPFTDLQRPVVTGTIKSPFGESIVVAKNGRDGQTTVTVDLEQSIEKHLVHAEQQDVDKRN